VPAGHGRTTRRCKFSCRSPASKGENTEAGHQQWIELNSVSFGVSIPVAAATGQTGKPQFDTVTAMKALDSASFPLYTYAMTAKGIDGTLIEIVGQAGGVQSVLYRVALTKGLIVAVSSQIQSAQAQGQETIQCWCGQMQWSTNNVSASGGSVVAFQTGWDVVNNKSI